MGRKKLDSPRDEKAVKLDRTLAIKAGVIADVRNQTIGGYLSSITRKQIEADWTEASRELTRRKGS